MSILTKIWEAIQSLWNKVPDEIRDAAQVAIKITKWLQEVVNSKELKTLVELTPTGIDDSILAILQRILPQIEAEITPASEELITWLSTLPEDAQKALYAKISQLITAGIHGNELKQSVYDAYWQIVFTKQKGE